ncbi:MAG: hypothetical protein K2N51_10400 [Lachnospiraceae bacterium]|nr:hypothetical protein [Lachnospiraceae bacterium]
MKQKNIILSLLLLCILFLVSCHSQGNISYTTPQKGISQKELKKQLDSKPSTVEKQDGMELYVYDNCNYHSYTGKMTYYFAEDMLVLSRWESIAESDEEGEKMYQDILKSITTENGEGTESEDKTSYSWDTEKKKITLGYMKNEEGYKVYCLENEQ